MKKEKETNKWLFENTTDTALFNKLYKEDIANKHGLCTYCKYHRGENSTSKWYGGFTKKKLRYPSWKLTSKKSKQWMNKPKSYKVIEESGWSNRSYITIKF